MTKLIYYSQKEFKKDIYALALKIDPKAYISLYPVPRGGIPIAVALSEKLNLPLTIEPCRKTLIVDDLVDSGSTRSKFPDNDFACLHIKKNTPQNLYPNYFVDEKDCWIEYWWEAMSDEKPAEDAVKRLIQFVGEDLNREGLKETPKRVINSWQYLFSGYKQKVDNIFKTFGNDGYNQIVLLKNIEIYSICEHHLLPFFGKAHIAYIPKSRVVGISKLARIADMYSKRMQIQERLGEQITNIIMEKLDPLGAACIIEAEHLCMRMRGVKKQNSLMITSSLKGVFLEDILARKELMDLIKK